MSPVRSKGHGSPLRGPATRSRRSRPRTPGHAFTQDNGIITGPVLVHTSQTNGRSFRVGDAEVFVNSLRPLSRDNDLPNHPPRSGCGRPSPHVPILPSGPGAGPLPVWPSVWQGVSVENRRNACVEPRRRGTVKFSSRRSGPVTLDSHRLGLRAGVGPQARPFDRVGAAVRDQRRRRSSSTAEQPPWSATGGGRKGNANGCRGPRVQRDSRRPRRFDPAGRARQAAGWCRSDGSRVISSARNTNPTHVGGRGRPVERTNESFVVASRDLQAYHIDPHNSSTLRDTHALVSCNTWAGPPGCVAGGHPPGSQVAPPRDIRRTCSSKTTPGVRPQPGPSRPGTRASSRFHRETESATGGWSNSEPPEDRPGRGVAEHLADPAGLPGTGSRTSKTRSRRDGRLPDVRCDRYAGCHRGSWPSAMQCHLPPRRKHRDSRAERSARELTLKRLPCPSHDQSERDVLHPQPTRLREVQVRHYWFRVAHADWTRPFASNAISPSSQPSSCLPRRSAGEERLAVGAKSRIGKSCLVDWKTGLPLRGANWIARKDVQRTDRRVGWSRV